MFDSMKVTVKKDTLINVLKANKEEHLHKYKEAYEEYKQQMILLLEEQIEKTKNDILPQRYIGLPHPENHKQDYDRILSMLDMDINDTFDLNEDQYSKYVLDNWDWKRDWMDTVTSYIGDK